MEDEKSKVEEGPEVDEVVKLDCIVLEDEEEGGSGAGLKRPLSPKAVELLGDPTLFPHKVQKVLGVGELSGRQLRRAVNDRNVVVAQCLKERQERIEDLSKQPPSASQVALPRPNERVSEKALRFFGDTRLEEASRRVVTTREREIAKQHPKVFKLLGDPAVMFEKDSGVMKRLGSDMNLAQRRAMQREKEQTDLRQLQERKRRLNETLKLLPTTEQLGLPPKAAHQKISDKALRFFGEPHLEELARKVVTPEMRKNVNPKTIRFFGQIELLSAKEQQLLGTLDLCHASSTTKSWFSAFRSAMPDIAFPRAVWAS